MEYTENYVMSINEALKDETFIEKLAGAENKEQFAEIFRQEKGIELEAEAAQAAFNKIESIKKGEELSAEDLENVAGGFMGGFYQLIGAINGAKTGSKMWGPGFGTLLGAAVGRQIASNIFHGRF